MSQLSLIAIALQGLGFGAAQVALHGLLAILQQEIQRVEQLGSGLGTRRRIFRVLLPAVLEDDKRSRAKREKEFPALL